MMMIRVVLVAFVGFVLIVLLLIFGCDEPSSSVDLNPRHKISFANIDRLSTITNVLRRVLRMVCICVGFVVGSRCIVQREGPQWARRVTCGKNKKAQSIG